MELGISFLDERHPSFSFSTRPGEVECLAALSGGSIVEVVVEVIETLFVGFEFGEVRVANEEEIVDYHVHPLAISEKDESINTNSFITLDADTVQETRNCSNSRKCTQEPTIAQATLLDIRTRGTIFEEFGFVENIRDSEDGRRVQGFVSDFAFTV